jgi:hypothetical protein
MKKSDLKDLIKPLVKECIHEVLLEEGLLSNVVSEVAKGMQGNLVVESVSPSPTRKAPRDDSAARKKLQDHRQKLMESISSDAYNGVNLFEGTEPAPSPTSGAAQGGADLGNPSDAGVDISSLMGGASKIWDAIK